MPRRSAPSTALFDQLPTREAARQVSAKQTSKRYRQIIDALAIRHSRGQRG